MVCECWMYANTDMGIICNPRDRYSRENVQVGSKKIFLPCKKIPPSLWASRTQA